MNANNELFFGESKIKYKLYNVMTLTNLFEVELNKLTRGNF